MLLRLWLVRVRFVSKDPYNVYLALSNINGARTILFDNSGDLLILARGEAKIYAAWGDIAASSELEKVVVVDAQGLGLNHGMAVRGDYLYAASDTTVYRWPYKAGQRSQVDNSKRQTVVRNISEGGNGGAPLGHFTRTLVFGPDRYLYISIGSLENVDQTPYRSRVRRIPLPTDDSSLIPNGGFNFEDAEIWADGLRNGVALAYGPGGLWEADNGPDNLNRADLGGEIYPDNPAEEVNLLDGPAGTFYGYPYW
ncbi:hypothetical protein HK102_008191 [Quaeritorhiza haematococci]|nr:hypothetical protein HK102_008191 [Quaeritorhiza haematococci]